MSQRRFSADEIREIAEAIETNEELPSDDWDVLNVCVSGTEESREWIVMVRDNHTLKSYRLKWSMIANGDEDLVYGEQDAPEVIPCIVYRRSSQVPFVMRFLEV